MCHTQVDGPTKSAQVAISVVIGTITKTDITHSERGTRPSSELFPAIAAHLKQAEKWILGDGLYLHHEIASYTRYQPK